MTNRARVFLSKAEDLLPRLPADSFDSIVCDPPYGLAELKPEIVTKALTAWLAGDRMHVPDGGSGPQGLKHCAAHIARRAKWDPDETDTAGGQFFSKFRIAVHDPALVVMLGAIQFKYDVPRVEQEVHDEGSSVADDRDLIGEGFAYGGEGAHHYTFGLRALQGVPGCVGECACFRKSRESVIRVPVRFGDNAQGVSGAAPNVVTLAAAELRAVLSLDVGRLTGELTLAHGADDGHAGLFLVAAQPVGAFAAASGLAAVSEPDGIGQVGVAAGGAASFDLLLHGDLLKLWTRPSISKGGFMGREWDKFVPPPGIWDEAYRVLKPGGHMLVFAGARTAGLMDISIRLAGFEIRDSLMWCFGSGMPKGLNVSKAIDKAAGAQRAVIGKGAQRAIGGKDGQSANHGNGGIQYSEVTITVPATPDAARWQGWNVAIKPAHEPIILARKPLSEGTIAANVLRWGTGALNVDGCKVGAQIRPLRECASRREDVDYSDSVLDGRSGRSGDLGSSRAVGTTTAGRWPPNLLLTHSADCRLAGTRKVATGSSGDKIDRPTVTSGIPGSTLQGSVDGSLNSVMSPGYADPDGTETVQAFTCAPDCPVAGLDAQSGTLTSGANPSRRGSDKFRNAYGDFTGQRECIPQRGVDTGGASRFFPAFTWSPEYDLPFIQAEQVCVLYGMLTGCERVNGATAKFLLNGQHQGSAVSDVPGLIPQQSADRPGSLTSSVPTAGSSSASTLATTGSTAPWAVTARSGVQNVLPVLSAESLCDSCATVIAQSIAVTQHGRSATQVLGLPSTGDFSEQILNRSLALFAEDLDRCGTTMTTTDWMTSLGYAVAAISTYIMQASRHNTSGSVQNFLKYQAKAPKRERPRIVTDDGRVIQHPTVKPLSLMKWLVRLVTQPGGVVLDPFTGTGPVVQAALDEGMRCVACDQDPDSVALSRVRLAPYAGVRFTVPEPAVPEPAGQPDAEAECG